MKALCRSSLTWFVLPAVLRFNRSWLPWCMSFLLLYTFSTWQWLLVMASCVIDFMWRMNRPFWPFWQRNLIELARMIMMPFPTGAKQALKVKKDKDEYDADEENEEDDEELEDE